MIGTWSVIRQQKIVDKADAGIEQRAVTGGTIDGDGPLKHVTEAIKLVAGGLRVIEHAQRLAVALVIRIEIATWLLRCNHRADYRVERGVKLRLITRLHRESDRLGPLINIGVGVNRPDLRRRRFAFKAQKIRQAAMLEKLVLHGRDA